MANTYVKVDVHLIFHVKITSCPIRTDDLNRLFVYLGGIIRGVKGFPIAIGGMTDHIHILASVPKQMALSDFTRIIKTSSNKWLKTLDKHYMLFSWQTGYGAFAVSPTLLEKTKRYILNQAVHHQKHTFQEEYILFLNAYGIDFDERYLFSE